MDISEKSSQRVREVGIGRQRLNNDSVLIEAQLILARVGFGACMAL